MLIIKSFTIILNSPQKKDRRINSQIQALIIHPALDLTLIVKAQNSGLKSLFYKKIDQPKNYLQ